MTNNAQSATTSGPQSLAIGHVDTVQIINNGNGEKGFTPEQLEDAKSRFRRIQPRPVRVSYTTSNSIRQAEQIRSIFVALQWPEVEPINAVLSDHVQGVVVQGYNHFPKDLQTALDAITIPFGPIDDSRIGYVNRAATPPGDDLFFIVGNL